MPLGFRIMRRRRKVDAALVERFRSIPVANVSDSIFAHGSSWATAAPDARGGVMSGPALTVKVRPGDNLMLHRALDLGEPGDVVVVDASGDLMLAHAKQRGVVGLVINDAVRDVDSIRAQDQPVFAAGVTHRGPHKDGPGEINVAIALDGIVIEPGDLVLGDTDGVLPRSSLLLRRRRRPRSGRWPPSSPGPASAAGCSGPLQAAAARSRNDATA